jgi:molybdopterin molybdotransferase
MLGDDRDPAAPEQVPLTVDLPRNGPRQHYMRAVRSADGVAPMDRQDSSLLSILAKADALIVRPPDDPARRVGDPVDVLPL